MFLFCSHLVLAWEDSYGGNFQLFPKVEALKITVSCKVLHSVFIWIYKYCFLFSEHLGLFFSFLNKTYWQKEWFECVGLLYLPLKSCWGEAITSWSWLMCCWGCGVNTFQGIFSGNFCFPHGSFCFYMSWCKPITSGTFCFNVGFLCALSHRNRKTIPSKVMISYQFHRKWWWFYNQRYRNRLIRNLCGGWITS